ncbi:histidinol-phosphate transaminase [Cohnella candidum]|uniref:Histidinol-phosphate aminotransferase n=1 Tax=Cohnella candidum TaxID=2674991 RepID=A0A3G3JXE8_9BACL|nr:histidinol-phosphate transaminase [Cohnella candidum]AYQ72531.1 histidinol-phosphate transaminase [Cohnella candidum]
MSKFWSPLAASLIPYVPGEQPKDQTYVKLNTNENPYPPSPLVLNAIKDAANGDLRLYPDPTCSALAEKAAAYYGVQPNQVFIGNGSDEILAFAFAAFFSPSNRPILFPDITYSFYKVYAALYGIPYKTVPLDEEFRVPLDAFDEPNGGIVLPNPNAPTARYIETERFRGVLDWNSDSVMILDEAYIDFGGKSGVELVAEFPNLLVVHTLSKSRSLAGLRVGVAIGHPDLIEGLNRVKNSFNSYTIDRLALAGAAAAFDDRAYFEETTRKVIATRERTDAGLKQLGFRVIDSSANFLFAEHPDHPAAGIFQGLKQRGVLVRYFNQPRIDNFIRISIGTDAEMDTFLRTLEDVLRQDGGSAEA